jgi:Holliday junction resolvase
VEGFLNFVDYREDFVFKQDKNTYTVTRDGICYGYVSDLAELRDLGFTREIDIQKIPYYRDSISIRDLDDMLHFQLVEHMRYLFAREGFHVRKEVFEGNKRHDLIASKERKKYIVEVKKGIKEDVIIKSLEQITRYRNAGAALLVTTTKISDEYIRYAREMNIIIIDRRYLKAIIRNQASISDLLKKPIT